MVKRQFKVRVKNKCRSLKVRKNEDDSVIFITERGIWK